MSHKIIMTAALLLASFHATALNLNNYYQNNFQQAKAYAAEINADAPGSFIAAAK